MGNTSKRKIFQEYGYKKEQVCRKKSAANMSAGNLLERNKREGKRATCDKQTLMEEVACTEHNWAYNKFCGQGTSVCIKHVSVYREQACLK
jgi:hypothetical protein